MDNQPLANDDEMVRDILGALTRAKVNRRMPHGELIVKLHDGRFTFVQIIKAYKPPNRILDGADTAEQE